VRGKEKGFLFLFGRALAALGSASGGGRGWLAERGSLSLWETSSYGAQGGEGREEGRGRGYAIYLLLLWYVIV